MGNYAEQNLTKNEKVIRKAKKSFLAVFPHFISFLTSELAITNKRVVGKVGLIRTHSITSPLNKIQNVTVASGLFGKIFGYGGLKIETAGSSPVVFYGIKKPEEFKKRFSRKWNCTSKIVFRSKRRKWQPLCRRLSKSKPRFLTYKSKKQIAVRGFGGLFESNCHITKYDVNTLY